MPRPAWWPLAATPVTSLLRRGFPGGRRLCPGAEFFGAGVPGQEPPEGFPGERLAAAAAFVEVGGQVGDDVQSGHLRGRGDGPDRRGVAGGFPVMGAAGVLLRDDRSADRPLREIIVEPGHRVVPVRDETV